jgi:hypothetical protein
LFAGAFAQQSKSTQNEATVPTTSTPRTVVTVIVLANEPPPTVTSTPAQPTFTPTLQSSPASKATLTPTATIRALSPRARNTFTPQAPPTRVATTAPRLTLVAPADGEKIIGSRKVVELSFQPLDTLGANEWYRVQVDFLNRNGEPESWCGWTQETSLRFPPEYFDDSSPVARSFKWHVNVARTDVSQPMNCEAAATMISAPSGTWTFYWY